MNFIGRIFDRIGVSLCEEKQLFKGEELDEENLVRKYMEERRQEAARRMRYYAICEEIFTVKIEGFVKPQNGMRVDEIAISVPEQEPYEIDASAIREGRSFWEQPALGGVMLARWEFPEKCKVGETYHLALPLKAHEGYVFAKEIKLIVNGERVDCAEELAWNGERSRECREGFYWRREEGWFDCLVLGWTTEHTCIGQY